MLATLATSSAAAADPGTAEALFQEGRALLERGELAAACSKFESSQASEPSGGTLLNLADCRARQGRTATAWAHFVSAERLSKVQGRPEQAAEAQRRRAELEPSLSTLTLHAADKPPGLEVKVNGRALAPGSLDSRLPMDPGGLSIEFSAPGRKPARVTAVLLSKAHHLIVNAPTLVEEAAAAAPAATHTPAPSVVEARSDTRADSGTRTLAWVIGGAGVAALAVGGTFGVLALSSNSEAKDACDQRTDECPPSALSAAEDRDRQATLATIGVGAGLVGLGVATVLLLTSSSPPDHSAQGQGLSLQVAPGLALISGTTRF